MTGATGIWAATTDDPLLLEEIFFEILETFKEWRPSKVNLILCSGEYEMSLIDLCMCFCNQNR